jgi:tetratricopeptide (TPR) repeat protein
VSKCLNTQKNDDVTYKHDEDNNEMQYSNDSEIYDFFDEFWRLWPETCGEMPSSELIDLLELWTKKYPFSATLKVYRAITSQLYFYFDDSQSRMPDEYYRQALRLDPFCAKAHNEYAELLDIQNRLEESKREYFCSLAIESNPEVMLALSQVLIQLNQFEDAEKIIDDCAKQCSEYHLRIKHIRTDIKKRTR